MGLCEKKKPPIPDARLEVGQEPLGLLALDLPVLDRGTAEVLVQLHGLVGGDHSLVLVDHLGFFFLTHSFLQGSFFTPKLIILLECLIDGLFFKVLF